MNLPSHSETLHLNRSRAELSIRWTRQLPRAPSMHQEKNISSNDFFKICILSKHYFFFLLFLVAKEKTADLMISNTAAYRPWTMDPRVALPRGPDKVILS